MCRVYHLDERYASHQEAYLRVERGLISRRRWLVKSMKEARELEQPQLAGACHGLGAALRLEFGENIVQMLLDGAR